MQRPIDPNVPRGPDELIDIGEARRRASEVERIVKELNKALVDAHDAGLFCEITISTLKQIGNRHEQLRVEASVKLEL